MVTVSKVLVNVAHSENHVLATESFLVGAVIMNDRMVNSPYVTDQLQPLDERNNRWPAGDLLDVIIGVDPHNQSIAAVFRLCD